MCTPLQLPVEAAGPALYRSQRGMRFFQLLDLMFGNGGAIILPQGGGDTSASARRLRSDCRSVLPVFLALLSFRSAHRVPSAFLEARPRGNTFRHQRGVRRISALGCAVSRRHAARDASAVLAGHFLAFPEGAGTETATSRRTSIIL